MKLGVDKIKFKIDSLCNTADPEFDRHKSEDMSLRFGKLIENLQ